MAFSEAPEGDQAPDRPQPLDWSVYEPRLRDAWKLLLDSEPAEPAIQAFLEDHPSLLPGAGELGKGGAHGAWWDAVIRQPMLQGLEGRRVPDFMWIRRDSATTRPILIEIEKPSKRWFTAGRSPQPTADFTQARSQLAEWRDWFRKAENQLLFNRTYVPIEYRDRDLEPIYVLIFGRKSEFRPPTRDAQTANKLRRLREQSQAHDEHMFDYDDLRPDQDAENCGCIDLTPTGRRLIAIPPTFRTGPGLLGRHSLLTISDSLHGVRSPWTTDQRRNYLEARWQFWVDQEKRGDQFTTMDQCE